MNTECVGPTVLYRSVLPYLKEIFHCKLLASKSFSFSWQTFVSVYPKGEASDPRMMALAG